MLKLIFESLNQWIAHENLDRTEAGMIKISKCEIRVVGQTALIEANLKLHVAATVDVDVFANYEHVVQKRFEELLRDEGKVLDPVGHEAWMPSETEYEDFFAGEWVHAFLAKPVFVMISKAKKAPIKNDALIAEYIASGAPELFFELANKYQVDLERFVK